MARQQSTSNSPQEKDDYIPIPDPAPAATQQSSKHDPQLDSLLDEIDSVLETNAEEFVKGFVQKGGQ